MSKQALWWMACLSAGFILVTFFGFYTTPLWDIDFWWHAASGRAIFEAGGLPSKDPLGVYRINDLRAEFLLSAYWLTQVLYHAILETAGITGIIIMRAVVLTTALGLVMWRSLRLGAGPFWTSLVTILVGITAMEFSADRPALFSFLGIAILMHLVDRLREAPSLTLSFGLVVLMTIWANSHGGVALGGVLLVIFAFAIPMDQRFNGAWPGKKVWWLIAILLAGALATLLSPNGMDLYQLIWEFEGGEMQARTSEYLSPWRVWRELGIAVPGYWVLLCLSLLAVIGMVRQRRLAALVITSFLLLISTQAFRYVPFFIFGAAPEIARALNRLTPNLALWPRIQQLTHATLITSACIALIWGAATGRVFQVGLKEGRFPVEAVKILQQAKLQGAVFNHYNWGGYLSYHAGPGLRAFIDGRNLDPKVFGKYTHILWVTKLGQHLLNSEGFKFVITPDFQPLTGEKYPINNYLAKHQNWKRIYRDQYAQVFQYSPSTLSR